MKIHSNKLRLLVLNMVFNAQSGHIGGSFSLAELIAYLYSERDMINKDKLILSKGHAVPIIYAALHEVGLLNDSDLKTFREINSTLQGHPDKNRLRYLHATTGSLGQGLSIAIGHALASKLGGIDNKIFCILGDGELQEGQIWEALMFAPKYGLDNLICIIDNNKAQNDGYIKDILDLGNLRTKIENFGWAVLEIDGHNTSQIEFAIKVETNVPKCIILDTIKGKGVSFMENSEWHSRAPNSVEYFNAVKELCRE